MINWSRRNLTSPLYVVVHSVQHDKHRLMCVPLLRSFNRALVVPTHSKSAAIYCRMLSLFALCLPQPHGIGNNRKRKEKPQTCSDFPKCTDHVLYTTPSTNADDDDVCTEGDIRRASANTPSRGPTHTHFSPCYLTNSVRPLQRSPARELVSEKQKCPLILVCVRLCGLWFYIYNSYTAPFMCAAGSLRRRRIRPHRASIHLKLKHIHIHHAPTTSRTQSSPPSLHLRLLPLPLLPLRVICLIPKTAYRRPHPSHTIPPSLFRCPRTHISLTYPCRCGICEHTLANIHTHAKQPHTCGKHHIYGIHTCRTKINAFSVFAIAIPEQQQQHPWSPHTRAHLRVVVVVVVVGRCENPWHPSQDSVRENHLHAHARSHHVCTLAPMRLLYAARARRSRATEIFARSYARKQQGKPVCF